MKMVKFMLISVLLIPATLFSSETQPDVRFTQISTSDGLSQNTVRAITEDKKGFIWAGTLDGLNRYDGYRILTYKPQIGDVNSLIDHRVKDVIQDKDDYLWIKTYKNEFNCYDPYSDRFIGYITKNEEDSYSNYYESSTGDIWLWGDFGGCLHIDKSGKHDNGFFSTPYLTETEYKRKRTCKFLYEDSKSTIWIGGEAGLFRIVENRLEEIYKGKLSFTKAVELNNKVYFSTENSLILEYDSKSRNFREIKYEGKNERFTNLAKLTNKELLIATKYSGLLSLNISNYIFEKPQWAVDEHLKSNIDFIIDKKKNVWVYNHTGFMWYHDAENHQVRKMQLIPPEIINIIDFERYKILIDSRNLIWITTYGNGLYCYDPATGDLQNYKYEANKNSLPSDYLLAITEDRYGNIWVGSEYAGIVKIVKSGYNLKVIRPEQETSIGKNNNVRAVIDDAYGNFWVGTKNGSLYVYDKALTTGKCIFKDINPYTLAGHNNTIWVGTKGNGLYLIDASTYREIAHYTVLTDKENSKSSVSHNTIFNIMKDSKNRMWIGTFGGGLNLAEEADDGLISFKSFFSKDGTRSYIRYIYEDSKGRIWVGGSGGLIRFNPEELIKDPKAYVIYQMDLKNKNGLNCNDIKSIYEDEAGTIWIGTAGGGLNKFVDTGNVKTDSFIAYTTKNGLSGDVVSGILEDKEHNLWISSESGITRFDKNNESSVIFRFSDKTAGNHYNENANIYCPDGNMLWGTLDGLLLFNPELFIYQTNTTPITLTNFFVYDQRIHPGDKDSPLKQSISYTDKIKLNHNQNTITIEFASLDLKDPQKNKYMYMLENYDKQLSGVSHLNTATYKNLPPGRYVFKVMGTNSDGVWSEEITELAIEITPPFWKSMYAYFLYFVLMAVLLYIAFRVVVKFNMLNNNIKVEKELTNYKLRFFTNISHEFRTPLTLIRGAVENLNSQGDASEQTKKQINVLSRNARILTKLIDQLLEFRKIQNNVLTLDVEETDIIDFCRDIFNSFEELAIGKNIQYLFVHDVEHYNMYIDKRKVDKILYNLLSNAFRFTPKAGKIELVISLDAAQQTCVISVRDNGIGIPKEKQHLLFSRFMQINFSSTGTGIGLSLVKEFIDVHKGKVWYEGNKGEGSVFHIQLSTNPETYQGENFVVASPVDILTTDENREIIPSSENMEDIRLPEIEDATLSNFKMLIIDDNDDIRDFLSDEFSKYFMVDTAENGQIGLQKAVESNPDLIICDVMMPEMDGFEVTKRLKEDFRTCHIPIILLTAYSSMEHQLEGIQSGADAYIMKPFSLKYLVTRVFKLIEQREQLKKRFSSEYVFDGSLITTTDKDKEFIRLIEKILEAHIADSQFTIDKFAALSHLGRSIFYKKVKGITGLSPNELIKVHRLKRAAELLLESNLSVSEIAYKVGFEDPFYFSKCFKAQYKCTPSKYGQAPTSKQKQPVEDK